MAGLDGIFVYYNPINMTRTKFELLISDSVSKPENNGMGARLVQN
jgi:hypothetical protein